MIKPTAFRSDGKPLSGTEVLEMVRRESSNKIMLSFSCGKDSIACWLRLREMGFEVTPFYMQLIPGLAFVEKSIQYYENFFGCHVYRLIHPAFYRWMYNYVFLDPVRAAWVSQYRDDAFFFGNMDQSPVYDMISDMVRDDAKLPEGTFTATGVRAADSPNRRSAINQYGAINWNRHTVLGVWDMLKDELIDLLKKHNCKLPVDYKWWGRSFDGLDYRFMKPLKQHAPADYAKILEFFPFIEAELFRYQIGE